MARQSKLQVAQAFIESLTRLTPTPGAADADLAAVIASARTNLELMAFSPEVAPTRTLVNASASDAQRHEDAMRRAKALTGVDSNNSGMQLSRLCDLLEERLSAQGEHAAADTEGPRFTTPDKDLTALLELSVDICAGQGNQDLGMLWYQRLQSVLGRLMPQDVASEVKAIPAWLRTLDAAILDEEEHRPASVQTASLKTIRAFLVKVLPMTAAFAATDDGAQGVRGEGDDADIVWYPAFGPRQPAEGQRVLAAFLDGRVKESYGAGILHLIKDGPTTLTHWAEMPPLPDLECLPAPWRPINGSELPDRLSGVLAGYNDGVVCEAVAFVIRSRMHALQSGAAVNELRCWRYMPRAPGHVDGQDDPESGVPLRAGGATQFGHGARAGGQGGGRAH